MARSRSRIIKCNRPTRSTANDKSTGTSTTNTSGIYSNVDTGRTGIKKITAATTNSRNPKDRLFERFSKGQQQPCAVSKIRGRSSRKKSTTARTIPSTTTRSSTLSRNRTTKDEPSDISIFRVNDSDSPNGSVVTNDQKKRQHRRSKNRNKSTTTGRVKSFYARRKVLCWTMIVLAALLAIGMIILAIVLALGNTNTTPTVPAIPPATSTFGTPEPYRGKVKTISTICAEKHREKYEAGCVFGSPPSGGSCHVGECTRFDYYTAYPYTQHDTEFMIRKETVPIDSKTTGDDGDQLCKIGDKLGVCGKDGQCNTTMAAGLRDETSWYEDARWEDNCDQPSPCWDPRREQNIPRPAKQERIDCRNQRQCNEPEANVVWLQHLRCQPGKNRTSARPCPKLPGPYVHMHRLWMCRRCQRNQEWEKCNRDATSCSNYICNGQTVKADGERCKHQWGNPGEAYCYGGHCLFLDEEISETNKPANDDECREKKIRDLEDS